jgi:hypothetical protein
MNAIFFKGIVKRFYNENSMMEGLGTSMKPPKSPGEPSLACFPKVRGLKNSGPRRLSI